MVQAMIAQKSAERSIPREGELPYKENRAFSVPFRALS